jgi:hypothetical protein
MTEENISIRDVADALKQRKPEDVFINCFSDQELVLYLKTLLGSVQIIDCLELLKVRGYEISCFVSQNYNKETPGSFMWHCICKKELK